VPSFGTSPKQQVLSSSFWVFVSTDGQSDTQTLPKIIPARAGKLSSQPQKVLAEWRTDYCESVRPVASRRYELRWCVSRRIIQPVCGSVWCCCCCCCGWRCLIICSLVRAVTALRCSARLCMSISLFLSLWAVMWPRRHAELIIVLPCCLVHLSSTASRWSLYIGLPSESDRVTYYLHERVILFLRLDNNHSAKYEWYTNSCVELGSSGIVIQHRWR